MENVFYLRLSILRLETCAQKSIVWEPTKATNSWFQDQNLFQLITAVLKLWSEDIISILIWNGLPTCRVRKRKKIILVRLSCFNMSTKSFQVTYSLQRLASECALILSNPFESPPLRLEKKIDRVCLCWFLSCQRQNEKKLPSELAKSKIEMFTDKCSFLQSDSPQCDFKTIFWKIL